MDDDGFVLVEQPPVQTVEVFRYENHSTPGYINHLWVCETGAVLYHSSRGFTGWHGNFESLPRNMASLDFDYLGREHRLKNTLLVATETGYTGVDYRGRRVTMRRLFKMRCVNGIYYQ